MRSCTGRSPSASPGFSLGESSLSFRLTQAQALRVCGDAPSAAVVLRAALLLARQCEEESGVSCVRSFFLLRVRADLCDVRRIDNRSEDEIRSATSGSIVFSHATKPFYATTAVKEMPLEIRRSEIFTLLGPVRLCHPVDCSTGAARRLLCRCCRRRFHQHSEMCLCRASRLLASRVL